MKLSSHYFRCCERNHLRRIRLAIVRKGDSMTRKPFLSGEPWQVPTFEA